MKTRTATTDASGCAVAQVSPATGAGTTYAAQLSTPGYVDLADIPTPSKAVGLVARGSLNNSVAFTYDAAATLQLRFVDPAGVPVPDAAVVGQSVSLVTSSPTGGSDTTVFPITSALMTVTGKWPTSTARTSGRPRARTSP